MNWPTSGIIIKTRESNKWTMYPIKNISSLRRVEFNINYL